MVKIKTNGTDIDIKFGLREDWEINKLFTEQADYEAINDYKEAIDEWHTLDADYRKEHADDMPRKPKASPTDAYIGTWAVALGIVKNDVSVLITLLQLMYKLQTKDEITEDEAFQAIAQHTDNSATKLATLFDLIKNEANRAGFFKMHLLPQLKRRRDIADSEAALMKQLEDQIQMLMDEMDTEDSPEARTTKALTQMGLNSQLNQVKTNSLEQLAMLSQIENLVGLNEDQELG